MYIFPLTMYTRTVRKLLCRVPNEGNENSVVPENNSGIFYRDSLSRTRHVHL